MKIVTRAIKLLVRFINLIWSKCSCFLSRNSRFKGSHDCSLVALTQVVPNLEKEKIVSAFSHCCRLWPYGGVTNKEFNIALRFLGLLEMFEYNDKNGLVVNDFLGREKEIFILLIYKHFTVVSKGKIHNRGGFISRNSIVYCSWRLLHGFSDTGKKQS